MTRRTDDQRENLDQHLAGLSCFISLVAFAPSCGFVLLRAKHLFSQAWPYQAGGGGHFLYAALWLAAHGLEIFDLNTCDAGLAGNFRFEYACGGLAKQRDPAAHCAASTTPL
jgi:hypothetical protein